MPVLNWQKAEAGFALRRKRERTLHWSLLTFLANSESTTSSSCSKLAFASKGEWKKPEKISIASEKAEFRISKKYCVKSIAVHAFTFPALFQRKLRNSALSGKSSVPNGHPKRT